MQSRVSEYVHAFKKINQMFYAIIRVLSFNYDYICFVCFCCRCCFLPIFSVLVKPISCVMLSFQHYTVLTHIANDLVKVTHLKCNYLLARIFFFTDKSQCSFYRFEIYSQFFLLFLDLYENDIRHIITIINFKYESHFFREVRMTEK